MRLMRPLSCRTMDAHRSPDTLPRLTRLCNRAGVRSFPNKAASSRQHDERHLKRGPSGAKDRAVPNTPHTFPPGDSVAFDLSSNLYDMTAKYVIIEYLGTELPIVLPAEIDHRFATAFGVPVSAGWCEPSANWVAAGESSSLLLTARPEADAFLLRLYFGRCLGRATLMTEPVSVTPCTSDVPTP